MGFFDRFKKQPKNNVQETPQPVMQPRRVENQDIIGYSCTEDGRLVVELYETRPEDGQFYDTTKLVIDNRQVNLAGDFVQNCMVAWYGESDCVYLDSSGKDIGRRGEFENVLAGIDVDLLQNDERYCRMVMKGLLNQRRVEGYLARGIQDNPEIPCGKYVGGVEQRGEEYKKIFYNNLGKASHNSQEMVNKRQMINEQRRKAQEKARADKLAEIARLQQEVDNMGR